MNLCINDLSIFLFISFANDVRSGFIPIKAKSRFLKAVQKIAWIIRSWSIFSWCSFQRSELEKANKEKGWLKGFFPFYGPVITSSVLVLMVGVGVSAAGPK
jgi:hypothetical protein